MEEAVQVKACDTGALSWAHSALQTPLWAAIKEAHGWTAHAFTIERGGQVTDLLVLVRPIFAGQRLAYIPFGPAGIVGEELAELCQTLKAALPRSVFALRLDLPFGSSSHSDGKDFFVCPTSIQPEATIRMDLSGGYEAVRKLYHERATRALRKIAASALTIAEYRGEGELFDEFYALYRHTAERDGFLSRSLSYLSTIVSDGSDRRIRLFTATLNGDLVGAIIVLFADDEALYLIGASKRVEGISPSYALQDVAIREACERGCTVYDLYGVGGPEGRAPHLSSLELFKRSFGGVRVERPPTMDLPYRRGVWRLYRVSERIRFLTVRARRALRRAP